MRSLAYILLLSTPLLLMCAFGFMRSYFGSPVIDFDIIDQVQRELEEEDRLESLAQEQEFDGMGIA